MRARSVETFAAGSPQASRGNQREADWLFVRPVRPPTVETADFGGLRRIERLPDHLAETGSTMPDSGLIPEERTTGLEPATFGLGSP